MRDLSEVAVSAPRGERRSRAGAAIRWGREVKSCVLILLQRDYYSHESIVPSNIGQAFSNVSWLGRQISTSSTVFDVVEHGGVG